MTLHGFAGGNISNAKPDASEEGGINFDNFRIEPESSEIGTDLKGTLAGLTGPLASAAGLDGNEEVEIQNERTYTSGVELFQAPQTLNSLGGASTSNATGKEGNGLFSTTTPGSQNAPYLTTPGGTTLIFNSS